MKGMLHAIKQQFQVELIGLVYGIVILAGVSIAGIILMYILANVIDDKEFWIAMGALLGAIGIALYMLVMMGASIGYDFNMQISLGCTRRHFFVSYYVVNASFAVLYVMGLMGIYRIEKGLAAALYSDLDCALDFWPILVRGGIPIAFLIIAVGGFAGALVMRFGMKAFWVMWAIWMFAFLGVPNISNLTESAPDSVLGRIGIQAGLLIQSVSVELWITAGVLTGIVSLAGTWLIIRRQRVTF